MIFSIFSKFEMAGGSEFRCVELANGISKFTEHNSFLLAEKGMPSRLSSHIHSSVKVIENCLSFPENLYNSDCIIVINTDVREFSTLDYWTGKSSRHSTILDINRLKNKKMFFLYNFLVSPSRHLYELFNEGIDVRILTTNHKFFNEITKQDRYESIWSLPRDVLISPIDQTQLNIFERNPKKSICFGMHSKSLGNKWNDEILRLITDINKRYDKNRVCFRFMGIKKELRKKIEKMDNVVCLDEDQELVKDFLSQIDIFLFFPEWKREEPWARVIAEAMVSGCPVVALDRGGTCDQVLKHNNGFLCKKYNDYYKHLVYLIEHPEKINILSKNSIRISQNFYTESVVKRLLEL